MDVISEKILQLKKQKNITILGHNYQEQSVQMIADILGDSLDLSRRAREVVSDTILFCGVRFMAETAKILSPSKRVLLPVMDAGCPMADMVTPGDVIGLRQKHPDAMVVCYVNSSAEVKAVSDVCCTSANAVKVVQNIPANEVIFVPDKNLGAYVSRFTDKKMIFWNGFCYVHDRIDPESVKTAKKNYPGYILIAHPECQPGTIDLADYVESTSGMLKLAKESSHTKFLVATEIGLIQRMIRENPSKTFLSVGNPRVCVNMKKTTLADVLRSLEEEVYSIELDPGVMDKARESLEKMLLWI